MKKSMFDIIKKQNGEKFAKAIRSYDSGIFDIPNLDRIVRYAGREAEPIMNYLISLKNIQIKKQEEHQDPIELLSQAGYNAYYADTLQKQNAIRRYFKKGEELCTFGDAHRFEKYHIINAVKKNVDDIKRDDFAYPRREDAYGTSVISIQVLKTGGFISIKNRYNHTVPHPDNTFNSNPDNIIEGLSDAIRYHYDVDFSSKQAILPEGYSVANGKIFKYHLEYRDFYFGKDFYVNKGVFYPINKDYEFIVDDMIFNIRDKVFYSPIQISSANIELLNKQLAGKKVTVKTYKDSENLLHYSIYADGNELFKVSDGCLTSVILSNTQEIKDFFLLNSQKLEYFSAPNLKKIGRQFMRENKSLKKLSLPNVISVGNDFLTQNEILEEVDMPMLEKVGDNFLAHNTSLKKLSLPSLVFVGSYFLDENVILEEANFPALETTLCYFLTENEKIKHLYLPSLVDAGPFFMIENNEIECLDLPNLTRASDSFLMSNQKLRNISLPNLSFMGEDFMLRNQNLVIDAPLLNLNYCIDRNITSRLIKVSADKNNQSIISSLANQRQKE